MPNWKKIILSGSSANLNNLYVDNAITASALVVSGDITANKLTTNIVSQSIIFTSGSNKFGDELSDNHYFTGSVNITGSVTGTTLSVVSSSLDHVLVNDRLQGNGSGFQFFAYNEDTVKTKFANWYSSNDRQYGMGQLWFETWFAAIDNQAARDNRRIGFYLEEPDAGSTDSGTPGQHPSNSRFYVDVNGAYLSGSLNVDNAVTASSVATSGDFTIDSPSDAQLILDRAANANDSEIEFKTNGTTDWSIGTGQVGSDNDFTFKGLGGSNYIRINQSGHASFLGAVTASAFTGDGSALTNISAQVTEQATITDTFTNATSKTVTHNFGTKNVLVSVYNNSDQLIIPSTITTTDTNTVDITLDSSTSGRVVVAKGGHLVSGSAVLSGTGVFSGSAQIAAATRYEESITGNTSYTITHNLDEDYPIVQVYDTNKFQALPGIISASNANSVYLEFDSNFTGRVVIKK